MFLCGGVRGAGSKEKPLLPPTLCQNIRYTLPSTHRRFPPLIWRARRITGATSPLGAILFLSGLKTQLCQPALPDQSWWLLHRAQLTSLVHRAKAGPTRKRPPDPSLLQHSGEHPSLAAAMLRPRTSSSASVGPEADGVLPWCGSAKTSGCDEGAGAV